MKFILPFLCFIFLFNCVEKEAQSNQVIKIDINEKMKDSLTLPKLEITELISLEKNDSSLFGGIINIEYANHKFYLLDVFSSKSLMVFSDEGRFINKTKLGRGPGEILNPFAFFVDKKNEQVLVYDQQLFSICKYDLNLNFLSKNKYEEMVPLIEFAKVNTNNDILMRSHNMSDHAFTLYSDYFNSIKKQFVDDLKYSGVESLSRSISVNNRILLISSYDYNIYQLLEDKLQSEYYIDFQNYNISKEEIEKKGMKGMASLIASGQKVSSLTEIAESENFILFHVRYKREIFYYIISSKTGKTYRLNDYFKNELLPKCKIRGVVSGDSFFAMVEPLDMFEFQEKTGRKLVEEEIDLQQNPFIITFSLTEGNIKI